MIEYYDFTEIFWENTEINGNLDDLGGFTPVIDETGKITGYKTAIGGADTVFPFSSAPKEYTFTLLEYTGSVLVPGGISGKKIITAAECGFTKFAHMGISYNTISYGESSHNTLGWIGVCPISLSEDMTTLTLAYGTFTNDGYKRYSNGTLSVTVYGY